MLWQIWLPVALTTAILVVQRLRKKYKPSYDLPVVGSPTDQSMAQAVLEGHQQYPESAFVIPCDPPRVILPMKLYQEVIHAPDSELSFAAELYDIFLGKYTHLGETRTEVTEAIRVDLTRNLSGILLPIQEEVKFAMKQMFGALEDWKSFNAYHVALRMVALMSGRVFVGLPLSRDEEWIQASITFATDVGKCRMAALEWNPWIRPVVLPFLPEVRHMRRALQKANDWMRPLVNEVLRNESALEEKPAKPGAPGAFVSWMMKYLPTQDKTSENMGTNQMLLSFAAIHTTSTTTTFALYDLLSRPEYIDPLRKEIEQVMAQDGAERGENGELFLSKTSLSKLKKLDSFIKESQRTSPMNFGGTARRLRKDQTFSNGLKLPAGTAISFPLWGVYNSSSTKTFSPEYNTGTGNAPPTEFDGFRFARLREQPGSEMKHQAAATGPDAFNFGHGPHACPGRFFAVYVIKCIFIEFLLNYDIRLKGSDGKTPMLRPPNMIKQMIVMPDFSREVEVRKRAEP
ncbi:cytochrome p450 monooxygenase [Colletotrichum incanum]|uniref:Cytochrome p450 monooxygenase n=1 Tax=Colletotrichum incanum TaxID=1573173 RepID=A0A167DEB5_COLIC|nr:cytochrome p450 monooxygenase [Colletotrichum incanum]OHW97249.1 cytochrome p450 monooxygenase [Colletotrichum incanum]